MTNLPTTDWRALCAELVEAYEWCINRYMTAPSNKDALVYRARTALAQPEPVGPTDEEIEQEAVANADTDDEYRAFKHGAFFVQERIHRPTIEPVPVSERLPRPEDCDAEGRCWVLHMGIDCIGHWYQRAPLLTGRAYQFFRISHWLPHWAMPVPGREP
jgi:hypothetical protein